MCADFCLCSTTVLHILHLHSLSCRTSGNAHDLVSGGKCDMSHLHIHKIDGDFCDVWLNFFV